MEITEPRRLYQQLAADLKERIEQGVYLVGDKLPAERFIADEKNVSRTVVREAIIMLEVEIKSGDATHLVVMPPKFALPAGSSKTVRFVAMEPEQKEKNYRVKFEAVPSIDDVATDKKDLSMQLTVNLIWGIVVSVPPQQPIAKLEVNAAQKLVNAGNQRLKILTIAYCKNNSKENCKIQTVNKNIFPGQERNLESISGYDKIVVKYNNWITKDNGEFELAVH
ncbi:GntR family transcriptional regulator [Escherichia coli]